MKTRTALILALLLVSVSAFSQNKIFDPNNLLPKIREFSQKKMFSHAFSCTDVASYRGMVISCDEVACDETGCWSGCSVVDDPAGVMVQRSVVNCTEDSAQMFIAETGELTDVSRSEFEAANSNSAEYFLSTLARFTGYLNASVYLKEVKASEFTLARGTPNERKVPSMNITFEFSEEKISKFTAIVSVVQGPGVAQIARFRLGDQTYFLLNDFSASRFSPICAK